jgi:3-phenylpropionate/trans-cinnamate dioxygenase ferredoxin subunit
MNTDVNNLTEVLNVDVLKPGEMRKFSVQNKEILVARIGDTYYAADNRCPHMNGDLSQGVLNGTVVTCPRHGSQFDLKDGHVIRWTSWPSALTAVDQVRSRKRSLNIYPVTILNGKVMVRI